MLASSTGQVCRPPSDRHAKFLLLIVPDQPGALSFRQTDQQSKKRDVIFTRELCGWSRNIHVLITDLRRSLPVLVSLRSID